MRPVISVPLPWLIILFGRLFGKQPDPASGAVSRLLRLPRTLTVTTEGKWYIGTLFLIGIAAINTGNNLLYLVVASLLSLIIVSGLMSESALRGLKASLNMPRYAFKGSPAYARITIENSKRFFTSFSLKTSLRCPGLTLQKVAYYLKLPPLAREARTIECVFTRRGRITVETIGLSTRFPFGLFVKGRSINAFGEVMVLPSINSSGRILPEETGPPGGEASGRAKGKGQEIFGVREYSAGEDSRLIHWKSSARAGRLLVKEFEREERREAVVVFENLSAGDPDEFEASVDLAASTVNACMEAGLSVGLKTLSGEVEAGAGREHLVKALTHLALLSPAGSGKPRVTVSRLR